MRVIDNSKHISIGSDVYKKDQILLVEPEVIYKYFKTAEYEEYLKEGIMFKPFMGQVYTNTVEEKIYNIIVKTADCGTKKYNFKTQSKMEREIKRITQLLTFAIVDLEVTK